jgi:survival-of-motor-neuron-related-splicing factor 30
MPSLAILQAELAETQENLDTCIETIKLGLEDDETVAMKEQFEEEVASLKAQIAAKKSSTADVPPPPPPPPSGDNPPKYDMSKHPKFRTNSPDPSAANEGTEIAKTDFKVGDTVTAKYSADKQWYPATIVSKTGSSADPVYTVNFTGYNEKENKRKYEVRAAENKKRKAEAPIEVPGPPLPQSPVRNGNVISAAASIDPTLVQKKEPSKVSDGPTRMAPAPKKLKGNKQLEKSKSSWASFQASGPKKMGVGAKKMGKESQFRTPDLPNAKGKNVILRAFPNHRLTYHRSWLHRLRKTNV